MCCVELAGREIDQESLRNRLRFTRMDLCLRLPLRHHLYVRLARAAGSAGADLAASVLW